MDSFTIASLYFPLPAGRLGVKRFPVPDDCYRIIPSIFQFATAVDNSYVTRYRFCR